MHREPTSTELMPNDSTETFVVFVQEEIDVSTAHLLIPIHPLHIHTYRRITHFAWRMCVNYVCVCQDEELSFEPDGDKMMFDDYGIPGMDVREPRSPR